MNIEETQSMNDILISLARFCAEHRLEKKYLVVSSYQVGHEIGEALARNGSSWVNLHSRTIPALAQEVAGAELLRQGIRFIAQASSFFLVERGFRKLKEARKFRYFGEVEATTGIVRALRNSLFALRIAGLKSEDLDPSLFIDRTKGEEIIALLRAYEEELERERSVDLPGLYLMALRKLHTKSLQKNPPEQKVYYLTIEDRPLKYLELAFLEKLAGDNLVFIPQEPIHGLVRPRRLRGSTSSPASPSKAARVPAPTSDVERLPWIFAPRDAPPVFHDDTIDIFSAIGPTNECREVVRRIMAEKIPFDDVEIIHPAGPTYPSVMFALAAKSGFKVTFGDGIPLAFTGPGRVTSGLIAWIEHNFLASELCALIEAGVIKLSLGNGEGALAPLKASRYLKSAMIGWGRERYVPRLETLIQDTRERVRAAEVEGEFERTEKYRESICEIRSLISLVRNMLELLPEADGNGEVDFGALCRGVASFIGKFAVIHGELDAEAHELLKSKLEEAAGFTTVSLKQQTAFEWLKNVVSGIRVGASGPAPGHLHLSSWRTGGYLGRPMTFVVGLDQSAFPGTGLQDPILLDEERERISENLETSADSLRENLWAMAGMLARLRGKVVLSYSSYDIIEERQSFPSSLILQAARLKSGDPELDYSGLRRVIPEAQGFLPGAAGGTGGTRFIDETDWWLGKLAPGGVLRDGMEAVKMFFHPLSRGIFAEEKRRQKKVGEFEGKIKIDPREVHPVSNPDIVISASRLESLAKCPFGYLMRYVLEVTPPEEVELDQSRWLNPMQRGTLLHDIFADFMKEVRRRGERVDPGRHAGLIRKIGEEIIASYREEIPPPSEGIFERERKAIKKDLEVFLKAEAERVQPVEPVLFEVSFGKRRKDKRTGEEEGEGKAVRVGRKGWRQERGKAEVEDPEAEVAYETVTVKCGERGASFRMAGRIDRIDRIEKGLYRVIDYKTGSSSPFETFKHFGRGRILQHALYGLAAEQIIQKLAIDKTPSVVESGYYFPTLKGEGKEIVVGAFDRERLAKLLAELLSVLETGRFVVNPEADCDFCDYRPVCGGSSARERAKDKRHDNPDVFDLFERLKEYE